MRNLILITFNVHSVCWKHCF